MTREEEECRELEERREEESARGWPEREKGKRDERDATSGKGFHRDDEGGDAGRRNFA